MAASKRMMNIEAGAEEIRRHDMGTAGENIAKYYR